MTANARPRRQDVDATRLRLLETGRELLMVDGLTERIEVRLSDVCKRAGYTTGAAYPIFGSQRGYQEELARFVASNFDWAGTETIGDELLEIVAANPDYRKAIRGTTSLYFERFIAQEDFYLALRFWAVREPSTELAAALAEGYRVVHEGFVELFDGLLAYYELRMRPNQTVDHLTMLLTALVEGLALRHRIQPEQIESGLATPDGDRSTLFAEGMIAIVDRLTEPIQREPENGSG